MRLHKLIKFTAISTLLLILAARTYGQSTLDGSDPNVNAQVNGDMRVMVVQSDKKILISGAFADGITGEEGNLYEKATK